MSIVNLVADTMALSLLSEFDENACIGLVSHMVNGKGSDALPVPKKTGADIAVSGPPVGPMGKPTAEEATNSGRSRCLARIDGTMCTNIHANDG